VIKVPRPSDPPEALSKPITSGEWANRTERDAVLEAFDRHIKAGKDPAKFSFTYAVYKNVEVKKALHELFGGKCAYCESTYASTQPMDVEHWRPKAVVHEVGPNGRRQTLRGYPWFAMDWSNLLPSCIDCNRARKQVDRLTGEKLTLGKANQFPVKGPRMLPPVVGGAWPPPVDDPLLLDPTTDNPREHLVFHSDGTVTPVEGSAEGAASIRVYALNREDLVLERLGVAQLVEQRLGLIEDLTRFMTRTTDPDTALDLKDLIAHELDVLYEMAEPNKTFSEMVRQLIDQNAPPDLRRPTVVKWPDEVADVLRRLTDGTAHAQLRRAVDHVAVAMRLLDLGYQPSATQRARSIHWEVRGLLRIVQLVQNKDGLVSVRAPQRDFALGLRVARPENASPSQVRFHYAASSLGKVLGAAAKLRAWADRD
jgi:uncharacterized protein (TIGR02646 family)